MLGMGYRTNQLSSNINPDRRFVDEVAKQLKTPSRTELKPYTVPFPPPRLALATTAFVVALIFLAVFASPALQVAAQEIFRFFARAESDSLLVPTQRPSVGSEANILTDSEDIPSFQIRLPTMLPEGYGLEQVLTAQEKKLTLHYATDRRVLVFEQSLVGDEELPAIGPSHGVFSVQVGDSPAEFTTGVWRSINSDSEGSTNAVETLDNPDDAVKQGLTWFPQSGFNRLRWRENGILYSLTSAGGSEGLPGYLGMLDLVRIAESLAPVPNKATTWTVDQFALSGAGADEKAALFTKSVDDVAAQAGIDLLVPTSLPANYHFDGGAYDTVNAKTTLQYSCGTGEWRLWLLQRRLKLEEAERESELLRSQIGASAEVEKVSLTDVTAEYVRGAWAPETPDEPGAPWTWNESLNFHQLIWYDDGILYQIRTSGGVIAPYSGPCSLDVGDLATMARSLK